ncbi:MAG TPA: hypothetical protein VJI75_03625 [Candidatus Nanoarchaeia archaeon]|nr:hypothetical protein [Candidatus Nanoarchaeia archaeon]
MGDIISSRLKDDGKVIFEVILDYEEARQLHGHMDKIHLFSENLPGLEANMCQRGKNEATKYFLIPRQLRDNLRFRSSAKCHKVETRSKVIFIYIMEKHAVEE